ncbi:hypothetical protein PGTUg99_027495 [Puccinia graminis f. sp. tritici]|uniref:JmjC domain-containing protein n=1 Tax=Puccinia graminis f. sp. tritici TaxID=56615 RepID=A0A5B0N0G3_PUCGR|nr:hypothetical protein PGTUg99_027495 [Puccinia graminis f. sp. tritici]
MSHALTVERASTLQAHPLEGPTSPEGSVSKGAGAVMLISPAHCPRTGSSSQPSINPRSIKPLGNLILSPPDAYAARAKSLGKLSILPDELLLLIFSELSPPELHDCQAVSTYFFAWCAGLDGLWKPGFISENRGCLSDWRGSWRSSYILKFISSPKKLGLDRLSDRLPTDSIRVPNVFSDVLFQPILCVNHSISSIIAHLVGSRKFHSNIHKLTVKEPRAFQHSNRPMILKELIEDWPAYSRSSSHRWTLESLTQRYPNLQFRAESTLTTLEDYREYHDNCQLDESPVYLFDSQFVEKSSTTRYKRGLGDDFSVPEIFQQDLFSCLGDQRPDYRWLIIGPARSGSTWHIDPNGTSAWNAVITGKKYWICFPPHTTPPGVIVNEDESEVESPLSISEWFLNYYEFAKKTYGSFAKDPETRGLMLEGVCEAGETFFVPSGWWHLVVNLEPSIAITQNFVSDNELGSVLHFMKHKPDQLSGFKLDRKELMTGGGCSDSPTDKLSSSILETFISQLSRSQKVSEQTLSLALNSVEQIESERNHNRTTRLELQRNGEEANHQAKKRKNQSSDRPDSSTSSSMWNEIKRSKLNLISGHPNKQSDDVADIAQHCNSLVGNDVTEPSPDAGGFKFGFDLE